MTKKLTAGFIGFTLLCGMFFTLLFGYKTIGKDIIDSIRSMKSYTGIRKIDNVMDGIEKGWNDGLAFRSYMIDVYGGLQKLLGKRIVVDSNESRTVLKGTDGKLYFQRNVTGADDLDAMWENEKRLQAFNEWCDTQGVAFLYVTAPHKYYSQKVGLPVDIMDYTELVEAFSQQCKADGIHCLNLMDELSRAYKAYSDGFFTTDHHWNIETAFWGFQRIGEYILSMKRNIFDPILLDEEHYDCHIISDCYLGSMGVRTGRFYAGMDDLAIISPKYKTSFHVEFNSKTLGRQVVRTGNFHEAMIDEGKMSYSSYITSDNPFVFVDNLENNSGEKMLLIKDSFGIPVAAWLSCAVDKLYIVDLRYRQKYSVEECIRKYGIDTVIMIYNPEMLGSDMFIFDMPSKGK